MTDRRTTIKSNQIKDDGIYLVDLNEEVKTSSISYIIDGGGLEIELGVSGDIEIPFDCEITCVTLLALQTGSIVIDIFKDTYANYPPSSSIVGSSKPSIFSGLKSKDTTLTGWTKQLSAGDTIRFYVDSVADIEKVTISLNIIRN